MNTKYLGYTMEQRITKMLIKVKLEAVEVTDCNDNATSRCWAVEHNGSSKCINRDFDNFINLSIGSISIILELYNVITSLYL